MISLTENYIYREIIWYNTIEFLKKEGQSMGYKILIVDDEREIADLIEMYLQNEN